MIKKRVISTLFMLVFSMILAHDMIPHHHHEDGEDIHHHDHDHDESELAHILSHLLHTGSQTALDCTINTNLNFKTSSVFFVKNFKSTQSYKILLKDEIEIKKREKFTNYIQFHTLSQSRRGPPSLA